MGRGNPIQCLLRYSQPMKSAKGRTTEVPSLENYGWYMYVQ